MNARIPILQWTTNDMKSFASWAIHSGKCRSTPSSEDIKKWRKEMKRIEAYKKWKKWE